MFVYLSKKIAIPNNTRLNCLAWNSEQDWIAVGGDNGLLKVLKLDSGNEGKSKGLASAANLSMNQTLEGHNGRVQVITWNEQHQKLTTSDENGLIIVWMMYKGSWYEEMINNRNKSVVKGMAWNTDGQRICIVYEDGAVIVGSVDGNRIWGKELKKSVLVSVQWSPDSKYLLFGLRNGELHLYDNQGVFSIKVGSNIPSITTLSSSVTGLDWYNGRNGCIPGAPSLAVCYASGQIVLMRDQFDCNPIVVETGMRIVFCSWNHNGTILAITGSTVLADEVKESNLVQFFSPFGEHLRSLKLPGKEISSCVWEGRSLRIAMAIDSAIYFANIRPDYSWTYFSNTLVFAYTSPEKLGVTLTFWDTRNNETYCMQVPKLLALCSWQDHCTVASKTNESENSYLLSVCNTITTTIDSKHIELEPLCVTMNSMHVFAASRTHFLLWHYITPSSQSSLGRFMGPKSRKERVYHVDDTPSGVAEVIHDLDQNTSQQDYTNTKTTSDPITCITCSNKYLVIGRESGILQFYSLPQVILIYKSTLSSRPQSLYLNCDSTRVAVVDVTGVLTVIGAEKNAGGEIVKGIERRDVWAVCWASDNPQLLAIMEKTRMYIIRGNDPEEPILTSAYIASFRDLEIKAVHLDDLLQSPNSPSPAHLATLEVKCLRDTRELLEKVGIKEASVFIEENPHPRLWRLLAEAAIKKLDLVTAETSYVKCKDYAGIQLVKQLSNIHKDEVKHAIVAAHFNNFNEAEQLFLDADRRETAMNLREKLGDWFRVLKLMKMGSGCSDSQYLRIYNAIGDSFADKNEWESAKEFYEKANNTEKLVVCYQLLEDFGALEAFIKNLDESDPLLTRIGEVFLTFGMCDQAVKAFLKAGAVNAAVEACVSLNHWKEGIDLASHHGILPKITGLLEDYASELITQGSSLEVIQLYRKAGRLLDAAKLLFQIAEDNQSGLVKPILQKKLYVLAAILVEEHSKGSVGSYKKHLINDSEMSLHFKMVDDAWHGAEAYHFFMLAQRQLFENDFESAMFTALNLKNYDDLFPAEQIYSLIALCSLSAKCFSIASRAFIKLESLNAEYEKIAFEIFTKYPLKDSLPVKFKCNSCSTDVSIWSNICENCHERYIPCILTGRRLENITLAWGCKLCRHSAHPKHILAVSNCPLCHSPTRY
ncbi:unnamed protein product [Bemisia tabaci]|uniref:WD repeat-containing protein 55 homolog n=1 Tax=Bemisia tabaci TaxID=7038 RepID=A0A9P0F8B9_BEMTA|nr:unnamed protein product [Bemisia tabaci]